MSDTSLQQTLLRPLAQKLVLDSTLFPQVTVNDPFGPAPTPSAIEQQVFGFTDWLLRAAKLKFTVYTASGPVTVAPWGEPGDTNYWPLVAAGLGVGAALAVYGAYKLATR